MAWAKHRSQPWMAARFPSPCSRAFAGSRFLARSGESLKFTQPLDVSVHPSGRIYVADFGDWGTFGGSGAIWVLEAVESSDGYGAG